MIKRFVKVILFIPIVLSCIIQLPFEIIRYIITGKDFNDPWFLKYFDL